MDVLVLFVGVDELAVSRHMGQNAQFDLGIVRVREPHSVRRNESLADLLAHLRLHGYVLKIGISRTDPARSRDRLVETRMDPSILRHEGCKTVRVSGFELCDSPVFKDVIDDRIFRRQLFQDARRRRVAGFGLLAAGHAQLAKEDGAQLLG